MTAQHTPDEREAFEAWLTDGKPYSVATERKALYPGLCGWDKYRSTHTAAMWDAWQARASLSLPSSGDGRDAERYRFLKERLLGVDFDYCESGKTVLMFDWPRSSVSADCDWTVDEAIAAMSQGSKSHD